MFDLLSSAENIQRKPRRCRSAESLMIQMKHHRCPSVPDFSRKGRAHVGQTASSQVTSAPPEVTPEPSDTTDLYSAFLLTPICTSSDIEFSVIQRNLRKWHSVPDWSLNYREDFMQTSGISVTSQQHSDTTDNTDLSPSCWHYVSE